MPFVPSPFDEITVPRLRFGIRSLLTLILIAACGLACWTWHRHRIVRREAAIQAVATAPDPLGWNFNPASLIRAVNQLHSLGRHDALMALEQFDKTYPNEGYSCPHQSLEVVIPLLFDRRNPDEKYPRPKNWFDPSEGIVLDQDSWHCWIMVEDGIPFHTVMIGYTSGMPGNQSYLIEWARDHARLRESQMIPGDLFQAAEKAMRKLAEDEKEKELPVWTKRHIRMQVYYAVAHLLELSEDDDALTPYDDERWQQLKDRCVELGIVWNIELQAFAAINR